MGSDHLETQQAPSPNTIRTGKKRKHQKPELPMELLAAGEHPKGMVESSTKVPRRSGRLTVKREYSSQPLFDSD